MVIVPNNIDNRLIATRSNAAMVITIGNTSGSYDVDIPCVGHDMQTGVSVPDSSNISLSNLRVYPLGLRITMDVSTAIAGTYEIEFVCGGRTDTELTASKVQVVITGVAGGVTYSYAYDIEAIGRVLCSRAANVSAPLSGQVLSWDGSSWSPTTISAPPRATKRVTEADFTTIIAGPGGSYELDWSNVLYDGYDLVVNVSGSSDATGLFSIVLPDTDSLSDGHQSRRYIYCQDKGDTMKLRCAPIDGADNARVIGRYTAGVPAAYIVSESDVICVRITRTSATVRSIVFEQRGKHKAYAWRDTNISSAGYTNPIGNNMLLNNFASEQSYGYTAASSQAWNLEGLQRRTKFTYSLSFAPSGGGSWTTTVWLVVPGIGEIPMSRLSHSSQNGSGLIRTYTFSVVHNWLNSDGNVVMKVYHNGQAGNFTNGKLIMEEV